MGIEGISVSYIPFSSFGIILALRVSITFASNAIRKRAVYFYARADYLCSLIALQCLVKTMLWQLESRMIHSRTSEKTESP